MNDNNFINSMLSDGGKISHKRLISVSCTLVICFIAVWATVKHPVNIPHVFDSLLIFVAVMSGVATVAQIITLVRGNPPAKEEAPLTDVDLKRRDTPIPDNQKPNP